MKLKEITSMLITFGLVRPRRHFRREFVLGMKKENYDDEELF